MAAMLSHIQKHVPNLPRLPLECSSCTMAACFALLRGVELPAEALFAAAVAAAAAGRVRLLFFFFTRSPSPPLKRLSAAADAPSAGFSSLRRFLEFSSGAGWTGSYFRREISLCTFPLEIAYWVMAIAHAQ